MSRVAAGRPSAPLVRLAGAWPTPAPAPVAAAAPAAAPLAADLCRALSDACEQAKVELAASTSVEIPITPPIAAALHAHALRVPTTWTLSRDDLAEACDPVLNACMGIVDQVLTESGVAAEEIKEIVLVGGSSRLLELRSRLVDRFDGKVYHIMTYYDIVSDSIFIMTLYYDWIVLVRLQYTVLFFSSIN